MQNKAGQPLPTGLPETPWPELNAAAAEYDSLLAERHALYAARQRLDAEHLAAMQRDREAWADEMEANGTGATRPRAKHAEKVAKEIEELEGRMSAMDIVIRRKQTALLDLIETQREEWADDTAAAMETAYKEYSALIEGAAAARSIVDEHRGLLAWLRNFSVEATYRPRSGPVRGLLGQNGEPMFFGQVLAALLDDATPTDTTPTPHLGAQAWPATGYGIG